MKTLLTLLLTILVINGCTLQEESVQPVVVKYKYKYRTIPHIQAKPLVQAYNVLEVQTDGIKHYVYTVQDAKIMASNWTSYRVWAEYNYDVLQRLKR